MSILAPNLRAASKRLGLSDAEVARRVGLSERAYAFYASGRSAPKLDILLKIAKVLDSSPNELLGWTKKGADRTQEEPLRSRLIVAAQALSENELELIVVQVEAVAARHQRPKRRK